MKIKYRSKRSGISKNLPPTPVQTKPEVPLRRLQSNSPKENSDVHARDFHPSCIQDVKRKTKVLEVMRKNSHSPKRTIVAIDREI